MPTWAYNDTHTVCKYGGVIYFGMVSSCEYVEMRLKIEG